MMTIDLNTYINDEIDYISWRTGIPQSQLREELEEIYNENPPLQEYPEDTRRKFAVNILRVCRLGKERKWEKETSK